MYGQMINILGFDQGISALRRLNDAVVLRLEGNQEALIHLTYGEEFSIGVLRYGGAYSALRRGARHFTPHPRPAVEDSAQELEFVTKLPNSENEIAVGFDFTTKPVFRDRIAVLVGQNGTGKTQFLKSMVDGLINSSGAADQKTIPRFTRPTNIHRALVFSSVPTDPFPRRIGAWEGIDYDYFPLNTSTNDGSETLLESLVALRFEANDISFSDGEERERLDILFDVLTGIGLKRLCLPLRKRQEKDDLPGVIEIEGNSYLPVKRTLNEQNTLAAYQQIEWKGTPTVMDEAKVPRELSSGEVAMLRFTAQSIAAIETGSLLLLDEPETHLHPKYVSDLIEVLYSLLEATKSIAIIATHSAYIVREASRENVKVLSLKDGILSFDTPRMQTFGASIDTISQFAFGDTNEQHHFQKVLVDWAKSVEPDIGLDGIIEEFGEHLNSESLSFIARSLNETTEKD
ncbi:excinuclease ABC subunit A [Tritonibacter horizontis]|uniref:Excinuclease ABC subunit A n=2 Tax=Tritonibacter horizontis TaxID=1768241 RepID=A0A132BZK1_9RHOB|nr:excinuclease ABC subunit A [Tritonibacter horizontis]